MEELVSFTVLGTQYVDVSNGRLSLSCHYKSPSLVAAGWDVEPQKNTLQGDLLFVTIVANKIVNNLFTNMISLIFCCF